MKSNHQTIRITITYFVALTCIIPGIFNANDSFRAGGIINTDSTLSYIGIFASWQSYLYLTACSLFLILSGYLMFTNTRRQQFIAGALFLCSYIFLCFLNSGFFIRLLMIPLSACFLDSVSESILSAMYFSIPSVITILIAKLHYPNSTLRLLTELVCLLLLLFLVWLITHLIRNSEKTNRKLYNALSETALKELKEHSLNQRLAIQNQLIDRNARLEERESMGRTIHNAVGHTITSAIVTLDAAQMLSDTDPIAAKEKVTQAKERMQISLSTIRQAVRLFDETNDQVRISDFYSLILASVTEFTMDTSLHVRSNLIAKPDPEHVFIDRKNSEFLHGAVLEALSNGVRHGHATAFTIAAKASHGRIILTVMDNGVTITDSQTDSLSPENTFTASQTCLADKLSNGYGLKKIRSFVENAGGDLAIHQENGFSITITLPLLNKKEASL